MKKRLAALTLTAICLRLALLAGAGERVLAWAGFAPITAVEAAESAPLAVTPTPSEDEPLRTPLPTAAVPPSTVPEPEEPPAATPVPSEPPAVPSIIPATLEGGVRIANGTELEVDAEALMAEALSVPLAAEGPQILIIHTHSTEAYTQDDEDPYEPSDSWRTRDAEHSVIRVGDELAAALEAEGFSVLHDRELYDYPEYSGAYARSGAAIEAHLAESPGISVVIDLHRDALGSGDVIYKPLTADGESAQLMLVIGTGADGLEHPHWRENLKFALRLQEALCAADETLARPVSLSGSRYNQQLTPASLILEVGAAGNTLPEALEAARRFAAAAAPALRALAQ